MADVSEPIRVSAVVLRDRDGRVLTVRKAGTTRFMLPGGKPEPGESPLDTAVRECREELGLVIPPARLVSFGQPIVAAAANETDRQVIADVFDHGLLTEPVAPRAEIADLAWVDPHVDDPALDGAPLHDEVFPLLARWPTYRIACFAGTGHGTSPAYREAATALGSALADRRTALVYGGGHAGLIGVLADAALGSGGHAHGVIPAPLLGAERAHDGLTVRRVVADLQTRKATMAALADGFVALPGGLGTLDELLEMWTWQRLGLHAKPVGLLNINGYWDGLLTMIDHAVHEGFVARESRAALVVDDDPDRRLDSLLSRVAVSAGVEDAMIIR